MGRDNPTVFKWEDFKWLLSNHYEINELLTCLNFQILIISLEDAGML